MPYFPVVIHTRDFQRRRRALVQPRAIRDTQTRRAHRHIVGRRVENWFFQVIDLRGVGPNLTVQALLTLDPDLVAAGVIQQTDSARNPRGRLYLPNTSSDRFARSVDLGTFGRPWQWLPHGATTCEDGS